ncbi:MAG: type II toxin-antitoxin system VapC family toxin [Proteobacteria bacterium]|nr:type II toxin-antitoxin system VapC family toxin [Pseudomonadota bacterium]
MNNKVVLDASALLALIQNERGADVVKPLLRLAMMSTINIAEVLTTLQRVNILPKEALPSLSDIIQTIVPFDIEQAQYVAELQPYVQHKGLSLGDRACLALGMKWQVPIYTADKIWGDLQLNKVDIKLIR